MLNCTEFAPQKFVPVIVTLDPTAPLAGVNEVIVGAAAVATVKFVALAVSTAAVSTVIGPVVAPAGTAAVALVSLMTEIGPVVALKVAPVAPVNPDPVIVTVVPTIPHAGVNDVTEAADAGSAVTSTPTTPSTSASAVARADVFFGSLKEDSPLLASRSTTMGATNPSPQGRSLDFVPWRLDHTLPEARIA